MQKYLFNRSNFLLTLTSWDKVGNTLILTFEIFNHSVSPVTPKFFSLKSDDFESEVTAIPMAYNVLIFGENKPAFYREYPQDDISKTINRNENRKLALAFKISKSSDYKLQIKTSEELTISFSLNDFLDDENYKISNMFPDSLRFANEVAKGMGC